MPVRWEEGPEVPGLRKDVLLGLEDEFALGIHFIEAVEVAHAVALFVKGYLAGEAVRFFTIVVGGRPAMAAGLGPWLDRGDEHVVGIPRRARTRWTGQLWYSPRTP